MSWLTLLLPVFIDLIRALSAEDPAAERAAMVSMERKIADVKAARKFGPRP